MKLTSYRRLARMIVLQLALLFACIGRLPAQTQPQCPRFNLCEAYLQQEGLKLPSYMPTLTDLMAYQTRLSTHQEITVEWNLISTSDHPVRHEEVAESSLTPDFTILERKQSLPGHARASILMLEEMELITVAVNAQGEIRGLTVGPGTPIRRTEHWKAGGLDVVNAKETFVLFLPDDPKIERLVFLLARTDGGDGFRLQPVGTLNLNPRHPAK